LQWHDFLLQVYMISKNPSLNKGILHKLSIITFSFLLFSFSIFAQTKNTDTIKTVVAGKQYKRSVWHNIFWGRHYRKEWAQPVTVKSMLLDTAKGGLIVTEKSGSRQSKGLRLKNKAGKEYVLRSIDKDFGNGLPDIFDGTFITRVAKDQASIGHPYAAVTIAALIAATDIYHTNPIIVYIPKQQLLDKYNDEYGNQLYLFEERPDEDQSDVASFGNSKNVIGTDKLYEKIYGDNDNRVNQKAFAKARLFDMLIGDWGRHIDQWRWAEFETGNQTIYKPIPRDRDQAYTSFDGFYPWLATHVAGATFLENFDTHLNNVKRFNIPGRPLDKKFLNELSKAQWMAIAAELKNELTDSVIENAVKQLPAEIFKISGNNIIAKLQSRRNELDKYADKYYQYLSHHVDVTGSQKQELFEINRLNNKETQLNIYKLNKQQQVNDKPYYSRIFKKSETKEIRLYGLEGEDIFKVNGNANEGVKIRVVDPSAQDSIAMQVKGRNKYSAGNCFEFDTSHQKKFDFFIMPFFIPAEYKVFDNDALQLFPTTGLRLTANIRYYTKPWRKEEFENVHVISANYGFIRGAFNIGYAGRLPQRIGKWDIVIKARLDAPARENFFGIGNNSKANIKVPTTDVYSSKSLRVYGGAGISRQVNKYNYFDFTALYQSVKVDSTGTQYKKGIGLNNDDLTVFNSKQFAGVEGNYAFVKTNSRFYPTRGIKFLAAAGYMQNLKTPARNFIKVNSFVAGYVPLSKQFTLAVRVGGAILNGRADYYHLNVLGGNENLRGLPRERFYGNNMFYNNNEIRWITNTHNYFYNGKIGLIGFVDNGRVWQKNEKSDYWHVGYGGGLIMIPFNRVALVGTYGISKNATHILLQAQVFF
jgi:hypothetical protein